MLSLLSSRAGVRRAASAVTIFDNSCTRSDPKFKLSRIVIMLKDSLFLRRLRYPRPVRLAEPRQTTQPNLTGVTVLAGERPLPGFHGNQLTSFIQGQEVKIIDEGSPTGGFAFRLATLSAPGPEEDDASTDWQYEARWVRTRRPSSPSQSCLR